MSCGLPREMLWQSPPTLSYLAFPQRDTLGQPHPPTLSYLALPQRDALAAPTTKPFILCELEQSRHGVGTRGQYKDQRGAAVGVLKAAGEVKGRWFDVLLAHVAGDEFLHSWDDFIRTNAAKDDHSINHIGTLDL